MASLILSLNSRSHEVVLCILPNAPAPVYGSVFPESCSTTNLTEIHRNAEISFEADICETPLNELFRSRYYLASPVESPAISVKRVLVLSPFNLCVMGVASCVDNHISHCHGYTLNSGLQRGPPHTVSKR